MIGLRHRRAEERHHAVADELVEGAAGGENRLDRQVEEGIQQLRGLLRSRVLGERGESDQVGEEHRRLGGAQLADALLRAARAPAQHLLDQRRRMVALEPRAHLFLELGLGGVAEALDRDRRVIGDGGQEIHLALAESADMEGGVDLHHPDDVVA